MSAPPPDAPGTPGSTPAPTPAGGPTPAVDGKPAVPAADAKPPVAPHAESKAGQYPRPAAEPLAGWRGAFEYTGIPRSWLQKKPRQLLPGPKMSVFLALVGGLYFIYHEDRKECKRIREEYIAKVAHLAKEPMNGGLDNVRKVTVYAARWPEDDEPDRGLKYFRKYVKPYLVAAAIDYQQVHAPLYGSVARIVRKDILRTRRETLGLQVLPDVANFGVPPEVAAQKAAENAKRAVDGGVVIMGRPTMKEYLAGMKAGWGNGVGDWVWEKEIEAAIQDDGVFDQPKVESDFLPEHVAEAQSPVAAPYASPATKSFLSRQVAPPPTPAPQSDAPAVIPEYMHTPPSPRPPTPPVVLVPWTNHLGFLQIPWMMYDFFTERYKVRSGAEAAYALIQDQVRPISPADTEFDKATERFYKGAYEKIPKRYEEAREKYYKELAKKLESARAFARGERDLTDEEKKSDKPVVTEDDLRAERRKRELRWFGGLEGFNIVRPETETAWDDDWVGWLNVYDEPRQWE